MTPTSNIGTLLVDAPVGRHFAQLHRGDDSLMASVSKFVEAGLRRGSGVVVIATPEHSETLVAKLSRAGFNAAGFRQSGQLGVYDAAETLDRCMRSGMPKWDEFRAVVGATLEASQAFGGVRAYGEMVSLLWREGKPEAAIKLEEFWNDLAKLYPFCLFCGYMLDSHHQSCYHGPLHEIGRTHSDVIATDDDERFGAALDSAFQDVFGIPLSQMLSLSSKEEHPGTSRLPDGQRAMLWISRHMSTWSADLLDRTKRYYSATAH